MTLFGWNLFIVVQKLGMQGMQAQPQKFWFIENLGKISNNLSKNFDIFQIY